MNTANPFKELEASMLVVLETYSNVHRGSGHFSKTTTHLYEKSREIVLDFLGLNRAKYTVLFFSPRRATAFTKTLKPGSFVVLHSREYGLNLGVSALAVRKKTLPAGVPFETGGGTTRLYDKDWVMWADAPDRFEAGTPAIINIIAFAKALLLIKTHGKNAFREESPELPDTRQVFQEDNLTAFHGPELWQKLQGTLIGRDVLVPTTKGPNPYIHFDNSASTLCFEPVWHAFIQAYRQPGQIRQEIVTEAKRICAKIMGAPLADYEVFFTSNTTESINIAAQSLVNETTSHDDIEPVILATILEHSSNDLPWRQVAGHTVIRLGVDNQGFFDMDVLEALLRSHNATHLFGKKRIRLMTVTGASNVLGSCNDLSAIGQLAKKYRIRLFLDAAQLAAHRKIDMQAAGIDYMAFSAHKVYAPFGTGVLIARKGLLPFSESERALLDTSSLENAGGIAALGKALLLLKRIGYPIIEEEEKKLTYKALTAMSKIPGIKIHGGLPETNQGTENRIGVIGFEIKDKMSSRIAGRLARRGGIGVRMGCHCAHLIIKQLAGFTPFQEKLQRNILRMVPILTLQGITRISFGMQNTEADVDLLVGELMRIAKPNRKNSNAGADPENSEEIIIPEKLVKQQIQDFIHSREIKVFHNIIPLK